MISDSRRLALFVLLAASILPYFIDLNGSAIWDANEAFYVETPREMIQRGDFVSPTFNYLPRLNKPVLSYWIVAAFYRIFGVSVGVQRLPIALGALAMILTAFLLAKAGADPAAGAGGRDTATESAFWAAAGLAVAPRLMMFGRRIFIDIYISMFMALTLLFFALSERYPERRRLFLLLMYGSVGLGMLTKGPVAAALPALVFAIYLLVHRELGRVREMMIPAGIVVVLAIVVPWYAALYHRYGWTYITSFFVGENIARYTEGIGVETRRGPLFYIPVVFSDSFPWSLCLFGAAGLWLADWRAARGLAVERGLKTVPDGLTCEDAARLAFRVRTLLWLWVLGIVAFFTFSAAKQDLYIFPIVPAVAALAGLFVARETADGTPARPLSLRITAVVIGLLLAVAGVGTLYIFQAAGKVYALDGAAFVGAAAAVGGAVALVLALANRARAALAVVLLSLITLNWAFVIRVLPSFERYKPVPPLSAAIRERLADGDVVAHYNVALPSMVYYLGRHIEILFDRDAFLEMLRGDRRVFAVLSASDYSQLQP
ncbi:MAG: glycosyltransferase family 39 protein, partial [Acidobacteriota bacterium]|nr:glycosyltransferase family 39 protein [Acidobacteriota bacterium]